MGGVAFREPGRQPGSRLPPGAEGVHGAEDRERLYKGHDAGEHPGGAQWLEGLLPVQQRRGLCQHGSGPHHRDRERRRGPGRQSAAHHQEPDGGDRGGERQVPVCHALRKRQVGGVALCEPGRDAGPHACPGAGGVPDAQDPEGQHEGYDAGQYPGGAQRLEGLLPIHQ